MRLSLTTGAHPRKQRLTAVVAEAAVAAEVVAAGEMAVASAVQAAVAEVVAKVVDGVAAAEVVAVPCMSEYRCPSHNLQHMNGDCEAHTRRNTLRCFDMQPLIRVLKVQILTY